MSHDPRPRKGPLYRSVNSRTHGVGHGKSTALRMERRAQGAKGEGAARAKIPSGQRHGRDYTPLYRFLVSRVGRPWDDVFSEAKARLDSVEPIYVIVARTADDQREYVRTGESTYFTGLFIDRQGVLARVNPELTAADLEPSCTCCTHTLNGIKFGTTGSLAPTRQPKNRGGMQAGDDNSGLRDGRKNECEE